MKRKIAVITGTRADFGLLQWTLKALKDSGKVDLQIIATGMHLSPEFGLTYQTIIDEGFDLADKVETLMSSDTPVGIAKSIGLGVASFSEVFARLKPDLVLVVGDRYEIFAACIAAMIARIPIAHCHGGESTEGAIDEAIRHSITKMSHLHFTSNEVYRKRIIQMGENSKNCFVVDGLGIENINKILFLTKAELQKSLNIPFLKNNFLITFHPVTLENQSSALQFKELLSALSGFSDTFFVFTKPNSDTDGRIIIPMIDDFVASNPNTAASFTSLGQQRYLSMAKFSDVVIGNSSSGLLEVPTLKVPTVNIGDRQKGRLKATSVIDCEPNQNAIRAAIKKALSSDFKSICNTSENPYGSGNASGKICEIILNAELKNLIKKPFFDLNL